MPERRRDPASAPPPDVDLERSLAVAAALDAALKTAFHTWLATHRQTMVHSDEVLAGLGVFISDAVRRVIKSLGLPPAAAAGCRERWLARLRADLEEEMGG
jgi:hypothetical protein